MRSDNEDEIDYENDDSWYEQAMNELDSPSNNHDVIYAEEDIQDLSEMDKIIIKYRNQILENGFEYVEQKNGDYIQEIVSRSGVIHMALCNFALLYRKEQNYMVIFQVDAKENDVSFPIQLATMIYTGKHLGNYQFMEFFHLEEELTEEQKDINGITVNREITYKDKPSFQFYKSDNEKLNKTYIEKMNDINPQVFEFLNEYIIVELKEGNLVPQYIELIKQLEV